MEIVMSLLMAAIGIVSLVCWIMILIRIFKDNVGLGILGLLCGIFAFVYGWVKVKEYDCKNIMIVWTLAFVAGIIVNALGGAVVIKQCMNIAAQSGAGA